MTGKGGLSFVIVFQPHYIVLAQVVAQLYLYQRKWAAAAVTESMVSLSGDKDVIALFKLRFASPTHHVSDSLNYHPVFTAARVTLQAEPCTWFNFQTLYLESGTFLQDLIASPGSLVSFSQGLTSSSLLGARGRSITK